MAQRPTSDFNIDPNITSGTDLSNILNRFQDAVDSGNSGTSRPAYLDAGGMWVKTGNPMRLYLYDGTNDNELYNTTDGIVNGSQWEENGDAIYYNDGHVGVGTEVTTFRFNVKSHQAVVSNLESEGPSATLRITNNGGLASVGSESSDLLFSTGTNERMRLDPLGRLGIGGQPSRSTKEIEDDAVSTLANWDSKDKKPTKAELIKSLTERNIGGGDAKLQVAGDGYFSGDVSCSTINGGLPFNTRHIIETLSTLREATQDETTLEGLRDSIGNAIGGLIEKFEAMQSAATQEIKS